MKLLRRELGEKAAAAAAENHCGLFLALFIMNTIRVCKKGGGSHSGAITSAHNMASLMEQLPIFAPTDGTC